MKKILSILMIVSLLMASMTISIPVAAEDTKTKVYFGDVDSSGEITSADALLALQIAVGKVSTNITQRTITNVDVKDGITSTDALQILQYAVSKIKAFPASKNENLVISPYTGELTYHTSTTETEIDGPIMILQDEASVSPTLDVPAQSIMIYIRSLPASEFLLTPWQTAVGRGSVLGNKKLAVMIPINRSFNNDYYNNYPDRAVGSKDSQTKADGSHIVHAADGDYMVPTKQFIEYKWTIIKQILNYDVEYIAFEEPELFMASGYSEGFKEEWVEYYGTPWEDQNSSADAMYKTSYLKAYLFERAFKVLSERIHNIKPDVKIVLASHSSKNYLFHSICSDIGNLANLDCIDGVIGQTWSDSARMQLVYDGQKITDGFAESYLEYSEYTDLVNDSQWLFALSDGASDSNQAASVNEKYYQLTVASQLLFPQINQFEFIWPSRAYGTATTEFKSQQLAVTTAQQDLAGKATDSYAGTGGIYYGCSDSETWQYGTNYMTYKNSLASLDGITVPLVKNGIPLQSLSLEQVKSADDLEDVSVLILSYDCMKPCNETVNKAISNWVKKGGQLLYIGGHDGFENIESAWWTKAGKTPLTDLLSKLGLNVSVNQGVTSNTLKYTGQTGYLTSAANATLSDVQKSYTATFTGSGITPILKCGNDTVGFSATAGKGNVTVIGIPSSTYSSYDGASLFMRETAEYACMLADIPYIETTTMLCKRGDYLVGQTLEGWNGGQINGKYTNIFSNNLETYNNKTIAANTPLLLKTISDKSNKTPTLIFTDGVLSNLNETASTLTYTVGAPTKCIINATIKLNGKRIDTIAASGKGESISREITFTEDLENDVALITYNTPPSKYMNVTITFK